MKRFTTLLLALCSLLLSSHTLTAQTIYPGVPSGYNGYFAGTIDTTAIADTLEFIPIADSVITTNLSQVLPDDSSGMLPTMPPHPNLSGLHPHIPNSFAVATDKYVGEIPIQQNIGPTGANMYQVPIEVVAGRNGLQPNLSIVYNSQGGNGIMGSGWNISGLSAITRVNKSVYYDEETGAMTNSVSNPFVLDGMRLIKTSSLNYITEQGNIKVLAYTHVNPFPSFPCIAYFKVFYPNGTTAIYGIETASSNTPDYNYPLTNLTDSYGNTMAFNYTFLNGHYYIENIEYGASASSSNHFAKIQFNYQTRSDLNSGYIMGRKITEDRLLKNIVCYNGTTALRTYSFTYEKPHYSSLLTQIDCSAGGSSLNPLKFHYGFGASQPKLIESGSNFTQSLSSEKVKALTGRFSPAATNSALIVYPDKNPYRRGSGGFLGAGYKFFNDYAANDPILIFQNIDNETAMPQVILAESSFVQLLCADIDGDSADEIIKIQNWINDGSDYARFAVYRYTNGSMNMVSEYTFKVGGTMNGGIGATTIYPKAFYAGDYTGDGKMELLIISFTENPAIYLLDLNTSRLLYSHQNISGFDAENDLFIPFDYDGDGKTDICHIGGTGATIYTLNSQQGIFYPFPTFSILKAADVEDKAISLGDLNGDGKIDIMVSTAKDKMDSPIWTTYLNTGSPSNNGFEKKEQSRYFYYSEGNEFTLCDVNNDGVSDFIWKCTFGGYSYIYACKNGQLIDGINNPIRDIAPNSTIVIGDTKTSSGDRSKVLFVNKNFVRKIACTHDETKQSLLTAAVNSYGVVAKTNYELLNDGGQNVNVVPAYACSPEQATAQPVFPYSAYAGSLWVATATQTYWNDGLYSKMNYSYGKAYIHRQGLGFRGFDFINIRDALKDRTATQFYDPYRFGVLRYEESAVEKTSCTWDVSIAADKQRKVTLREKTGTDKLANQQIRTTYLYDPYANLMQEKVFYDNNITTTVDNSYLNKTTSSDDYVIGLLQEQKITKAKSLTDTWTTKTIYTYTGRNKPESQKDYVQSNLVAEKNWTYDATGNVLTSSERPFSGTKTFTESYTYDNQYRYLMQKTDARGLPTRYTYHPQTGLLTSEEEACFLCRSGDGLVTQYEYDAFGRLVKTTSPTGTIARQGVQWETDTYGVLYSVTNTASSSPESRVYYDAFNREQRSYSESFDSTKVYAEKQYDDFGRLVKTISPAGETVYTYDQYDRPVSVTAPTRNVVRYTYNGLSTTETKDNNATTTTRNVIGETVKIVNPEGTIEYTLRTDGQPSKITAGGITTTIEYDNYGRQTKLVDPSAGTQQYEYDASGRMAKQTNAKGQITSMAYDDFGQVVKKQSPEMTANYTYRSDGLILKETSGVHTLEYEYDKFFRPKKITEAISYKNFISEYTYSGDKLSYIYYPTLNYKTHYTYNALGFITRVNGFVPNIIVADSIGPYTPPTGPLPLTEFADMSEINCRKKITRTAPSDNGFSETILFGNNYTQQKNYNRYGMQTSISTLRPNVGWWGPTVMMDDRYEYDNTKGLLTQRSYHPSSGLVYSENFSYDNQQRLTGYGMGEGKRVHYAATGNITEKTDAGRYAYSGQKPYAIAQLSMAQGLDSLRKLQDIQYNSAMRPSSIHEGGYHAYFDYGVSNDRCRMEMYQYSDSLQQNIRLFTRYYFAGGRYEVTDYVASYSNKNPFTDVPIGGGIIPIEPPIGGWKPIGIGEITPGVISKPQPSGEEEENENDTTYVPESGSLNIGFDRPESATLYYTYYTDRILYVDGSPYAASMAYTPDKTNKHHYIHRDRQGSVRQITNNWGQRVAEYFYDPWGRQTDVEGNAYAPYEEPLLLLGRGYTGHEHLPWFNLINMNARLYDPVVGRFLSPDPYVQAPTDLQNFNRYSYCLNNPLIYTDPSGEYALIDDLIAAVIGGVINLVVNAVQGNIQNFGHAASLFGVGFVGGWATIYTGPVVGAMIMSGGNSVINQGFTNGWDKISFNQVATNVLIGAGTAWGGSFISGLMAPITNSLYGNIASPVVQQALTQGTNNAVSGFGVSTGVALLQGADIGDAVKEGGKGAIFGAGLGLMTGTISGMQYAHKNGLDPWTGRPLVTNDAFLVTPNGIVLPKGAEIPSNLIENPDLPGRSYGISDANGKFQEVLRIDPGTPPGMKGHNESHFHLNGRKQHIFDINKWPWWYK